MDNKNVFAKFGDYVRGVLDRDKNGRIDIHEILNLFPNSAIAIAALFVDLVILIGEYRVYDFAMTVTGDVFKAIGFIAASAVPFYLGQLFWLYPRANGIQRTIAVGMMTGGLYMSISMGFADLTKAYDVTQTISNVVWFSAGCVVAAIIYIMRDDGIRAWRLKVTTLAAAQTERMLQESMRVTLTSLQETMQVQEDIIKQFGAEAVEAQLSRIGKRKGAGSVNPPTPPSQ
jgi:hypothetical protein